MIKDAAEVGKKFRASISYGNSPIGKLGPEKRGLLYPNVKPSILREPAVNDPRPQPYNLDTHQPYYLAHGHRENAERIVHELVEKGKKIKTVKVEFEFEKE